MIYIIGTVPEDELHVHETKTGKKTDKKSETEAQETNKSATEEAGKTKEKYPDFCRIWGQNREQIENVCVKIFGRKPVTVLSKKDFDSQNTEQDSVELLAVNKYEALAESIASVSDVESEICSENEGFSILMPDDADDDEEETCATLNEVDVARDDNFAVEYELAPIIL